MGAAEITNGIPKGQCPFGGGAGAAPPQTINRRQGGAGQCGAGTKGVTIAANIIKAAILLRSGIDQWIKVWAINNLQEAGPRSFLKIGSFDWMHLRYIENDGAAFSMLSGSRLFLIVFPIILLLLSFYLMLRLGRKHRWIYPALTLIAAGGLGNLIDRIFRGGKVVDYLDFQLAKFAVFNFADCCVTVGVILTIIGVLFFEKESPESKKSKPAERVPYARLSAELPESEVLPEAADLPDSPDAALLPELKEEQTDAGE